MRIEISSDAEKDIENGYWFYESQSLNVGDYFRSSIFADIETLIVHGGSHPIVDGYHRKVCKTFPYKIYYEMTSPMSLTESFWGQAAVCWAFAGGVCWGQAAVC